MEGGTPGRPRTVDPTAELSPETAAAIKKGTGRAREVIETITAFVRGGAKNPTASRVTPEHHAERAEQVRAKVTDALGEQGVDRAAFRTEVLDDKKFEKRFGSERGQAVTVIENGVPVVYARPGASDADLQHEATHIAQLRDASNPQIQQDVRILSGETMKGWKKADAGLRKELLERKLRVEIDAAERELAVATPDARVELEDRLANLRMQQAAVESLTEMDLAKINAGVFERPYLLEDPAYLFAKGPREAVDGEKQSPFALREQKHAEVEVTDSPAKKLGRVVQLGQEWTEAVIVTTSYPGVVSIDRHKKAGAIVVQLDHEDTRHSYVVENDATLLVKDGDRLAAGDVLAHEKSRKHRLVEIKDEQGNVIDTRTEERVKNRWQQSGEHSRARGEIAEHAARRQIDAELDAEMRRQGDDAGSDAESASAGQEGQAKRAPLTGHGRIDNQTGSGSGFDDVVIEFRGSGDALEATVRIVETKEYPNRTVPLADMTAIRSNIDDNLKRLTVQVANGRAAATEAKDGLHAGMTVEQYEAIQDALLRDGGVHVELRLGETTRVSSDALRQLKSEVEQRFGAGTFRGAANIEQDFVDASVREMFDDRGIRRESR